MTVRNYVNTQKYMLELRRGEHVWYHSSFSISVVLLYKNIWKWVGECGINCGHSRKL